MGMVKRWNLHAAALAGLALVPAGANAQDSEPSRNWQERLALEKRVDELRVFERDYRLKLKSYIEGQLRELDTATPVQVSGNQGFSASVGAPEPASTFQGFGG